MVVLYFARDVLLPIAVAVLVSFLLAPVVRRIESWRVPHVAAVLATTVLTVAAGLFAVMMVAQQLVHLAEELPQYEQTFQKRIEMLREHAPMGLVRAVDVLQGVGDETFFPPSEASAAGEQQSPEDEDEEVAIPVEIRAGQSTLFDLIEKYITPAFGPLVSVGMVIVLVIFILLYRSDLRDRLLRLAGGGNTRLTDKAVNEAAGRVSGYLMMQFVNNVCYGLAVGFGLWLIGLPGAVLWGLGAMLVRFIPYLGPWLGSLLPILFSLGVFGDWLHPLLVVAMFVTLEVLFNNFIEPYLFGAGAGISPLAVIVALFFWGWVWGGIGLLVAVPLTACLVVTGRYVPQLQFFTILMADDVRGNLSQPQIVTSSVEASGPSADV